MAGADNSDFNSGGELIEWWMLCCFSIREGVSSVQVQLISASMLTLILIIAKETG